MDHLIRAVPDADVSTVIWATRWVMACAGAAAGTFEAGEWASLRSQGDANGASTIWLHRPWESWRERWPPVPVQTPMWFTAPVEPCAYLLSSEEQSVETTAHWAMWLPSAGFAAHPGPERIKLVPVRARAEWDVLAWVTTQLASERGHSQSDARRMCAVRVLKQPALLGSWYVVLHEDRPAGELGLFVMETPLGRVGAIAGGAILPSMRGQGLGGELLGAACGLAATSGLDALSAVIDGRSFARTWLWRAAFRHVGTWTRFVRTDA